MKSTSRKRHGFTLIELLIVVAIIGILAAIAVPNFLEAQTRSKVASVVSGMRTVATGLEAYAVDYNGYPLTLSDQDQVMHMMGNMRMAFVPRSLSTPVAYLTDVPLDDFKPKIMNDVPYPHKHSYIYVCEGNTSQAVLQEYRARVEGVDASAVDAPHWALYSTGPDQQHSTMQMLMNPGPPPRYGLMFHSDRSPRPYDPTNGTVSQGDIVRFSGE